MVKKMTSFLLITMTSVFASSVALPYQKDSSVNCSTYPFPYISREDWGAQPPTFVTSIRNPVPYVVLHHTYIPSLCTSQDVCKGSMRSMQNVHQLTNGWADIGYNFAVGGEGSVFEGRGWGVVGAHAVSFNSKSVGIAMIGDFVSNLPPQIQMQSVKKLVATGVELGHISPDYRLIGHRQASATECPGQAFFNEMSTWDRFEPNP